VREDVFEANENRRFELELRDAKRDDFGPGRETAHSGPFADERQHSMERDVFAEDNEHAFAVTGVEVAVGSDQETGIETVDGERIVAPADCVVRSHDQPDTVAPDEICDGVVDVCVPANQPWHRGFRPNQ
jgi:hypothetical protein